MESKEPCYRAVSQNGFLTWSKTVKKIVGQWAAPMTPYHIEAKSRINFLQHSHLAVKFLFQRQRNQMEHTEKCFFAP